MNPSPQTRATRISWYNRGHVDGFNKGFRYGTAFGALVLFSAVMLDRVFA